MFKRLSNKLVVTLFVLLLLLSTSFIGFAVFSAPMFLQELNQKLNLSLADNIVKEKNLFLEEGGVNEAALQSVFMGLMLVNPVIEVYLVDTQGKVLAFSAPEGVVKRKSIDLDPVRSFLDSDQSLPVLGNDPRDFDRDKVFSAAPIYHNTNLQGYLYIVLGGQAYDSVVELLESSYMLRLWTGAVGISLLIALLAGFLIFRHITARMKQLSLYMEKFKHSDFQKSIELF